MKNFTEAYEKDYKFTLTGSEPVPRTTLNQKVYESLKAAILSREIPGGSKLSEAQVAKELNVSSTPVREAFRMLSAEGLVKTEPFKGVFVRSVSFHEIKEAYQCREVLEGLAFDLLMKKYNGKLPDEEIAFLEDLLYQSRQSRNVTKTVKINSQLHNYWIDNCGNAMIGNLMRLLNEILLRERNFSAYDEQRRQEICEEHKRLVEYLKNSDIAGARQALMEHIANGCAYSERLFEKNQPPSLT